MSAEETTSAEEGQISADKLLLLMSRSVPGVCFRWEVVEEGAAEEVTADTGDWVEWEEGDGASAGECTAGGEEEGQVETAGGEEEAQLETAGGEEGQVKTAGREEEGQQELSTHESGATSENPQYYNL